MAPVHFDQQLFVSCEDQLASIAGLHNFACTVSGAVILAQPIRAFRVAKSLLGDALSADAMFYLAAKFLLFYLNLHQHATGYANPDLESGGCLHSIFLSNWMVNNPLQDATYSSWTLPQPLVRGIVGSAAGLLLATCWLAPEQQTALAGALSGPFSLYVIATMGSRSWHLKKARGDSRCFKLWVGACLGLIAAQVLVVLEEKFVCRGPVALARTFHPILTHAVIVLLFFCVSECAIALVHESQTSLNKASKMA